ncbi:AL8A1 dehydrogenase, partial [Polyodon spathula]|nr:AL8A1 dehydrogenase [Polyodon spathula]
FPAWSFKSPQERSQVLDKLANVIDPHLKEFAQAEAKEQVQHKPLLTSCTLEYNVFFFYLMLIVSASNHNARHFRIFASSVLHNTTECTQMDHMGLCTVYDVQSPVYPGGSARLAPPSMLPWSLNSLTSLVSLKKLTHFKPTVNTEITSFLYSTIVIQAYVVPAGVVNIVFGTGPNAGEALVSPQPLHRTSPGEVCLCTSRIFVQKSNFNEILQRFVEAARNWKT